MIENDIIIGLIVILTWLTFGPVFGLIVGLNVAEMKETILPSQGIRQSAKNTAIVGLIVVLIVVLISLVFWSPRLLESEFSHDVLIYVLIVGLIGGLTGGLIVGMYFGGFAVIQHFALRFVLSREGLLPLRPVTFLDYATERIFLRKVGGGYVFVHRMLMDYFASLEPGPDTR